MDKIFFFNELHWSYCSSQRTSVIELFWNEYKIISMTKWIKFRILFPAEILICDPFWFPISSSSTSEMDLKSFSLSCHFRVDALRAKSSTIYETFPIHLKGPFQFRRFFDRAISSISFLYSQYSLIVAAKGTHECAWIAELNCCPKQLLGQLCQATATDSVPTRAYHSNSSATFKIRDRLRRIYFGSLWHPGSRIILNQSQCLIWIE